MGVLVRLLLVGLALLLVATGLRRLAGPGRRPRRRRDLERAEGGELMVQDPQCGRFVPQRQSITVRRGSETLHFCGSECQARYLGPSEDKGEGR